MKPNNKPKHTRKYGVTFDSKYEASIAGTLRSYVYYGAGIKTHQKLLIKPDGGLFPEKYWHCDYVLTYGNDWLNIEAKGYVDDTFLLKMQMLEVHNPADFDRLIIVVPTGHQIPRLWEPFKKAQKIVYSNHLKSFVDEWMTNIDEQG